MVSAVRNIGVLEMVSCPTDVVMRGLTAEPTDEALFDAYRQSGDRRAFDQLIKRYEGELYGFLRRRLNDSLAQDVFQSTFFNVVRYAHSFMDGRSFRPWLYQIARNLVSDMLQLQSRERAYLDTQRQICDNSRHNGVCMVEGSGSWGDDPADSIAEEEIKRLQVEQVHKALASLPEAARRVITLVYFQGMNYREAAEVLGCDSQVIRYRMFRAIKKLNALLEIDDTNSTDMILSSRSLHEASQL